MLISLCLAAAMILPVCAFAEQSADMPFRDVKAGEGYYENVRYVYENGIMKGTSDTEFSPDGTLTRAMCVTVLHRMAGEPAAEEKNTFTDVTAGEYYEDATDWAQSNGIVNGKTRKIFAPEDIITRAEFSTMIWRYLYYSDLDLKETKTADPSDLTLIPSFAKEAVALMYSSGVLNGRENGAFDPDAPVTRAEAAAIIERFNKTAVPYVNEDDGVLDIAFIGDSFTYVPEQFDHFQALAEGKHAVRTYNETLGATPLLAHYNAWKTYIKYFSVNQREKIRKWDAVVLNESMTDEPYTVAVDKLIGLFGPTKDYYAVWLASLTKEEDPSTFWDLQDGNKAKNYPGRSILAKGAEEMILGYSNESLLKYKDDYLKNHGLNVVLIQVVDYDPSLGLKFEDFFADDLYHPDVLTGYCEALALYCTIFDEPAVGQNRGALTDGDIPGDTAGEKDAFILMLQNLVEEQLDLQNARD